MKILKKKAKTTKKQLGLKGYVWRTQSIYNSIVLPETFTKEIRKQKYESWKKFVYNVGNQEPWSIIYKIVAEKIKDYNTVCSIQTSPDQFTTNWKDTMNVTLDKCTPKDTTDNENRNHQKIKQIVSEYKNCNLEPDVSESEVEEALKKLKNNKYRLR